VRFIRTFQTAIHALQRNVMRAILTTLGIIIGIAAVMAMVAIGNGSADSIQKTISSMGANSLLIFPGSSSTGGVSSGAGTGMNLTPEDCNAVLRDCPEVMYAAPIVRVRTQVIYGNRNTVPDYEYGTTPAFLNVRDWTEMTEGSCFSDQDVRNSSKVCLIGTTTAHDLFDDASPIGQEIRLRNAMFKVVGVLGHKGASMGGQDQDNVIIAPWTSIKANVSGSSAQVANQSAGIAAATAVNTLSQLYPSSGLNLFDTPTAVQQADTPLQVRFVNIDQILVSAAAPEDIAPAMQEVNSLLRERHKIPQGEDEDFQVRDMTEMVKKFTSASDTMGTLLFAVACISLVVGGVGIMNIMLVSVTERTREIGLRMAVGARARDILRQFLAEAVLLCMAGGILGIALGYAASKSVTAFLGWATRISLLSAVVAFLVSALVGVVFGFYPAWKASRLDPIDALRYE
jgi:ABC-type antimicrobial peptide transport system permease subunit